MLSQVMSLLIIGILYFERHDFFDNKKERGTIISALIRARDIPNINVTLLVAKGGPAFVTSTTHKHIRHAVHNHGKF